MLNPFNRGRRGRKKDFWEWTQRSTPPLTALIRAKLLDRRKQLSETIERSPRNANERQLLDEVDAALDRLTTSRYGICETCNEPIEVRQLLVDPTHRHCIWHVAPEERDKVLPTLIRNRLVDRRKRLCKTIEQSPSNTNVRELLGEVDAALDRLTTSRYGICETCNEPIEVRQLLADPLRRHCISHLTPEEHDKALHDREFNIGLAPPRRDGGSPDREMEAIKLLSLVETNQVEVWDHEAKAIDFLSVAEDLNARRLVAETQRALLPDRNLHLPGWELHFEYMPAGPVGGDYCDLVPGDRDEFFLFFGDVMGKGFAGSKIASQLNGVIRALLDLKLPIDEMLERANRIFGERVQIIGYYATLVCTRVSSTGALELINAGHPPPLLLRPEGAERIASTGLPLGLFSAAEYEPTNIRLTPGETLLFYTDGVTEARNRFENEYGIERLSQFAAGKCHLAPKDLVRACRDDLFEFTSNAPQSDDIILLALRHI